MQCFCTEGFSELAFYHFIILMNCWMVCCWLRWFYSLLCLLMDFVFVLVCISWHLIPGENLRRFIFILLCSWVSPPSIFPPLWLSDCFYLSLIVSSSLPPVIVWWPTVCFTLLFIHLFCSIWSPVFLQGIFFTLSCSYFVFRAQARSVRGPYCSARNIYSDKWNAYLKALTHAANFVPKLSPNRNFSFIW